ncbi:4772_t:CDS:10 [Paraglomus occultum]|uniref:ER membrane protein complex subunit 1 n=1 Tax=Paraglomus occultum TaxID=144539 RepID=A0A9N9BZA2_9GLOM|nr:4772_t:CDS:10 [Paraglomus occultum]
MTPSSTLPPTNLIRFFKFLSSSPTPPSFEWIPYNRLKSISYFASGEFSSVARSIWLDGRKIVRIDKDGNECVVREGETEVCVKRLDGWRGVMEKGLNKLCKGLTACPNQTSYYYGLSIDPITNDILLVMKYFPRGDLCSFLYSPNPETNLSWLNRLKIIRSVASALVDIHKAGMVHGNIHPKNILRDNNGNEDNWILGDLGAGGVEGCVDQETWARGTENAAGEVETCDNASGDLSFKQEIESSEDDSLSLDDSDHYASCLSLYATRDEMIGVLPYTSPDILRGNHPSSHSDIYSLGILMSELVSLFPPYYSSLLSPTLTPDNFLLDICDGYRPRIPPYTPGCFINLMKKCWCDPASYRPGAREVFEILDRWCREVEGNGAVGCGERNVLLEVERGVNGSVEYDKIRKMYESKKIKLTELSENEWEDKTEGLESLDKNLGLLNYFNSNKTYKSPGQHVAHSNDYFLAWLGLVNVNFVDALYESQTGVNDWHHQYIGTPTISFFHKLSNSKLVALVATEKSVVAALNPTNGNITWRQILDEREEIIGLKADKDNVLSVSIAVDYIIRLWDGLSGKLLWENIIKKTDEATRLKKADVVFLRNEPSIAILLDSLTMVKFDLNDGKKAWVNNNDHNKQTKFVRIVDNGLMLNAVALVRQSSRYLSIRVVTYGLVTGDAIKTLDIKSRVEDEKHVIVVGGAEDFKAFVIWTEKPNMRANRLGRDDISTEASLVGLYNSVIPSFAAADGPLEFIDLDVGTRTEFLVEVPTKYGTAAAILKIDTEGGRFLALHDMNEREGKSVYSAAFDSDGKIHISRVFNEAAKGVNLEIVQIFSHQTIVNRVIKHSVANYGYITSSILCMYCNEPGTKYRMILLSADGSIHSWKDSSIAWKREEPLTHAVGVEFVDLPEKKLWSQEVDELDEDADKIETITPFNRYIRRVSTHLNQLRDLLDNLIAHITRLITNDKSAIATKKSGDSASLHRDIYGFRKILVFVTPKKIIALDSARKGEIVWTRYLNYASLELQKIFVVRAAMIKYPPVIIVVGKQVTSGGEIETRLFRLNALTGGDFEPEYRNDFPADISLPLNSIKTIKLPIEEPNERTHILALIDAKRQATVFRTFAKSFYFTLERENGLSGYKVSDNEFGKTITANEIWSITFPSETIASVGQRPLHEKVSSLGRVLGDRSVLYKYLNPHLVAIATFSSTDPKSLSIYLIDIVKGSILYHAVHANVSPIHRVFLIQVENYILYHFWSNGDPVKGDGKGFQVVVCDLYESEHKNERFESANFSSFSHERPYVDTKAFMFPHGINAIGVTTTKNGITTREFLFATKTDQVYGIAKRVLDARRPTRTLTAEDKEEMLIPYDPAIPDNRKSMLSYYLTVAGIRHITTSPALLESTSLVLAYGLDIWFTREAPSKTFDVLSEDFSKETLVTTIVALLIGIAVTRPIVNRRKINARWY